MKIKIERLTVSVSIVYKKWDVHTDGQTDKANTICPADFSQAGHYKSYAFQYK